MENKSYTKEELENINLSYKTSELSFFEKFLEMYWVNPKSWLLDELVIKDAQIDVLLKNGVRFQASLSELSVKWQTDTRWRKELYLSCDNRKIHFKEISGMLTDEQWKELLDVLCSLPNTQETAFGKLPILWWIMKIIN